MREHLPHPPEATSPHDVSDAELLGRVRAGDATAYGLLFRRHHASAVRISGAMFGSGLAEEHVAEAFARVLELLQRGLGPERSFLPYLVTTIRNMHIDHLRKQSRVHLVADVTDWLEERHQTEERVDLLVDREAIDALRSLPARWREVLWLRTVEGLTLAETAATLGLSRNATAQLTLRARDGLRAEYLATLEDAAAS